MIQNFTFNPNLDPKVDESSCAIERTKFRISVAFRKRVTNATNPLLTRHCTVRHACV